MFRSTPAKVLDFAGSGRVRREVAAEHDRDGLPPSGGIADVGYAEAWAGGLGTGEV